MGKFYKYVGESPFFSDDRVIGLGMCMYVSMYIWSPSRELVNSVRLPILLVVS